MKKGYRRSVLGLIVLAVMLSWGSKGSMLVRRACAGEAPAETSTDGAKGQESKKPVHLELFIPNRVYPMRTKAIVSSDVDGDYTLTINNTSWMVKVENHFGFVDLGTMDAGTYTAKVFFEENDEYGSATAEVVFCVNSTGIEFEITLSPTEVVEGGSVKVSHSIPDEADGIVEYYLGTSMENANLIGYVEVGEDLELRASEDVLTAGTHVITAYYSGDRYHIDACDLGLVVVHPEPQSAITVDTSGLSELHPGDSFRVPVVVTENDGFADAQIQLSYDSEKMTLTSLEIGSFSDPAAPGKQGVSELIYTRTGGVTEETGVLFYANFEVDENAPSGEVSIGIDPIILKNEKGNSVNGIITIGKVTITPIPTASVVVTTDPSEGGSVDGAGQYREGSDVTLTATPEAGYEFVGWTENGEVVPDAGAVYSFKAKNGRTLTANFKKQEFTVTFVDFDNTELQSGKIAFGEIPKYNDHPTREADAQFTYVFEGWEPKITAVTGNATYKATYSKTVNKYKIMFVDEDGKTVLMNAKEYDYGTTATDIVRPVDPTKKSDAQYTYTFAGWDQEIRSVTCDVTYKATYSKMVNQYKVTFVDEDGKTVINATAEYAYGTAVANIVKPKEPTKASDAQYSYTFAGWEPMITDVTEDVIYKATYEATPIPITKGVLTFDLGGGTLDGQTGKITIEAADGDVIKLPGAPLREGYTFQYWEGSRYEAGSEYKVEGDHTFTAVWEKNKPKTYIVSFNVNSHGTAPDPQIVIEGNKALKPTDPSEEGYTFEGWCSDAECRNSYDFSVGVEKDTVVYAKWTKKTVVIEETDPTAVNTGDGNRIRLWMAWMSAAAISLGLTVFVRRRVSQS